MNKTKSKTDKSKSPPKARPVRKGAPLPPGYASWITNVIAPALVEMYLRENRPDGGAGA